MYFIDIAFHDLDYKLNKLFDHKMFNKKKKWITALGRAQAAIR